MARNGKYQPAAIRLAGVLRIILLLLLGSAVAVGYVWQKNLVYQLGQQIKKRELRLAELRDQNEKLRQYLAKLRSPAVLEARVRELNLGLAPLGPHQEVFTLVEPQPEPLDVEQLAQHAAGQTGLVPMP